MAVVFPRHPQLLRCGWKRSNMLAMKIRAIIGGLLEKPSGVGEMELDMREGSTVRELLAAVGYCEAHIPRIMAAVNGTIRKGEHVLKDGDEVRLSILVGGG